MDLRRGDEGAEGFVSLWALGVLVALTLAIWAPVLSHGFVNLDDPDYVTDNAIVASGLSVEGLRWAFNVGHAGNWHPVTWLSHMLDVSIYGLEPAGHHATSVLLHTANAVLFFLILKRLLRSEAAAWGAAVAFAIHPLRIESVAWIAERKDVLCAFFWLAAILAYVRYAERPRRHVGAGIVALAALALASKPMAVTLPVILLLLDVWPLGRARSVGWTRLLAEKAALFVLAIASSVVTVVAQRAAGAVTGVGVLSLGRRAANAAVAAATYVVEFAAPGPRSPFWPYPEAGWPVGRIVAALVLLAVVSIAAIAIRKRSPGVTVGWTWFVVALLPVIGIVQVGMQARADRYTYIPHMGLLLAASCAFLALARVSRRGASVVAVSCLVWIGWLASVTVRESAPWRDSRSLFAHAAMVAPDNFLAHYLLGLEEANEGRFDESAASLREAIRIRPSYAPAWDQLGHALAALGRTGEAIEAIEEGIRRKPDEAWAHFTLGGVLLQAGRPSEAIGPLRRALELDRGLTGARISLGRALEATGDSDAAIVAYRDAAREAPRSFDARLALGMALAKAGTDEAALAALDAAARLAPNDPRPHLWRAFIGLKRGDRALVEAALRALEPLNPEMASAVEQDWENRGQQP